MSVLSKAAENFSILCGNAIVNRPRCLSPMLLCAPARWIVELQERLFRPV